MSVRSGKWGRSTRRKPVVVVHLGVAVVPDRTPGVRYQDFFSSPLLKAWFMRHDDEIDARLERAGREEYLRNCELSRRYRARKAAKSRKSTKAKARAV